MTKQDRLPFSLVKSPLPFHLSYYTVISGDQCQLLLLIVLNIFFQLLMIAHATHGYIS